MACSNGQSIDVPTYIALCTTIDYDGLQDLLELKSVQASWNEAARKNAEAEGEGDE